MSNTSSNKPIKNNIKKLLNNKRNIGLIIPLKDSITQFYNFDFNNINSIEPNVSYQKILTKTKTIKKNTNGLFIFFL